MYSDGTRYDVAGKGKKQKWNPKNYPVAKEPGGANDGQELWDKLVKRHDNFLMTLNGHVLNDGAARLTGIGDKGNKVHQILSNYQTGVKGSIEGGNGWLRVYTFKKDRSIEVRTYSPVLDECKTGAAHQFTLTW